MEPLSPRYTTIEALRATLRELQAGSSSESEDPALQSIKHQIIATLAQMELREAPGLAPPLAGLAPPNPADPAELAAALREDQPTATTIEMPAALLDPQVAAVDSVAMPNEPNPPPPSGAHDVPRPATAPPSTATE